MAGGLPTPDCARRRDIQNTMMFDANHALPRRGDGRLALNRGQLREIASWQFSVILFTNATLAFFEGPRVKTFETLRDRVAICQTRHGRVSEKAHPARHPYERARA
jgi:hypothetical protein